jgi:hypothetical protein
MTGVLDETGDIEMGELLDTVITAHGGFMLKRWDYETDVLGGVAAHYSYDPVTVEGIVFPTLRRVVLRTPDGPLLSGRTSFVLDYTDVEVRT